MFYIYIVEIFWVDKNVLITSVEWIIYVVYENNKAEEADGVEDGINSTAQAYTFRQLATATKNFRQESLLGEGGIGRVYKGKLQSGQVIHLELILI